MRTQVTILGAGPAGLLLSHLLAGQGIESVIIETRSQEYVQARLRAGVLEQGTVDLLTDSGVGERLHRVGLKHDGIYLQTPQQRQHLDFPDLCGRSVWVYGQTEVVKDVIAARLAAGQQIHFEVSDTAIVDADTDRPAVRFVDSAGQQQVIHAEAVAGCDGFHGITRPIVQRGTGGQLWERTYPYSWLGILADVPPSTDELIYAWHPDGFAMHSMRSEQVSRLYLQVDATDQLAQWSDDRIWTELSKRLASDGWLLADGPVTDKSIIPMGSFVSAPMRARRVFLAGDAAHIVPPTGAKGLNLAATDVELLADALTALLAKNDAQLVDAYSDTALRRVWRATHFSWWMTSMLHVGDDPFDA